MAIGAPCRCGAALLTAVTGSAGLFNTITGLIGKHWVAGIIGVVASVGWLIQLIGGLVLYKLIWNFKNHNAEISWGSAKTEFTGLKTIFKLFRSA